MLSWLKMHLGMDCLAALALCICIWCFLCLKMHLLVWSRIFLHHILEKSWLEDADFFSGQRKSDFGKSRMRFFQIDASSNGNPTKYKMHFKLDSSEFQQNASHYSGFQNRRCVICILVFQFLCFLCPPKKSASWNLNLAIFLCSNLTQPTEWFRPEQKSQ